HIALAIEKSSIDENKSKLDNDIFDGLDENNKINNMSDPSLRVPKWIELASVWKFVERISIPRKMLIWKICFQH
ncbi:MAG: hypothetical protein ACKESA_01555, partial [Candidatus Hodgkinia cicadicola]